jgi:hypothetical protein
LSISQLLAQLSKPKIVDDTTVKKKIMEQYGFVDKEEDARYHRPNVSKKCVSCTDFLRQNRQFFVW